MKNKDTTRKAATIGAAIIGGMVVKGLIRKIRFLIKRDVSCKQEIHQAPWSEAIKWTLTKSIVSGIVVLVLKRYLS